MFRNTDTRECFDCGSDRIQSADAPGETADRDYCFDCGYVADCVECFDTRTVVDPYYHPTAPVTCGDCA